MSGGGGSGGGGPMARVASMINQAPAQEGVGYSAPQTANPYQPAFSSQQGGIGGLPMAAPQPAPQQMQQGAMSPLLQQQMAQQQQQFRPQQFQPQGIQQLLNSMMNRFQPQMQQRQMPMPMQAPQFRSPALSYRPNMANAQQALTRVKPSVYKTELDTARARIAELEAAQQPQDSGYGGGGG
jgi:hypothetical protein